MSSRFLWANIRSMFEKVKLGLALGAGGARGAAHLGVLKGLEEAGVRIGSLAGTSIGAVVGGAYAAYGSAADLEARLLEFLETDLFQRTGMTLMRDVFRERPESLAQRLETFLKRAYVQALFVSRTAILDTQTFQEVIAYFIPEVNIESLPLSFCALGTDLHSGRPVLFRRGSLRQALFASAAIPGAVSPVQVGDLLVADGGVLNMVPVSAARSLGADVVLAVDVERTAEGEVKYKSGLDLIFRVEDIQSSYLKATELRAANLVLRPKVGHIHWSDFRRAPELIRLGQDELLAHLDQVRRLAKRRRRPWWWCASPPPPPPREWIEV